jgi:HD-like signal output (HDOD) protein
MSNLPAIEIDPKTFLYNHCELPALPEILIQIQQLMTSNEFTATKISNLISNDPSMVAEILKVANSAYYSFAKEIKEVKFAVAYMGINEVYRIILSLSVVNSLSSDDKKSFNKLWQHSVYTALCARHLSRKYEPLVSAGEVWAAAILHDIGKLVYLKFFPEHFRALFEYSEKNGVLFSESEKKFKLPKSSYLGVLLCDRWRLPIRVKEACEFHGMYDLSNSTGTSIENSFTRMISAGNLLAILMAENLSKQKSEEITSVIKSAFRLTDEEFSLLAADISELKIEAENFISN